MKPHINTSSIFIMAEGLMLLRPRNDLDHACDVDSDTNVRKEGSRGKKQRKSNFYAVAHCYLGSE